VITSEESYEEMEATNLEVTPEETGFSESSSVSPANHRTECSILITVNHPGLMQLMK
jgi:hypothetical protein